MLLPNSSINYTVTGTDINNCKSTTNFQLNVGVKPDIYTSSADVICEGQSIIYLLMVQINICGVHLIYYRHPMEVQ